MSQTQSTISFENNIKSEYLKPSYIHDIKTYINDRFSCRTWGYRLEIISKVTTGMATILSFMTGAFPNYTYGNYISGMLGVAAMSCQHLSTYSFHRSRENTELLNTTLQTLGIEFKIIDSVPVDKDTTETNQIENKNTE